MVASSNKKIKKLYASSTIKATDNPTRYNRNQGYRVSKGKLHHVLYRSIWIAILVISQAYVESFLMFAYQRNKRANQLKRQHNIQYTTTSDLYQISSGLPVLATASDGRPKTDKNNDESSSPISQDPINITIPEITLYRKHKQSRRQSKYPRRPNSFWTDVNNIQIELRQFWTNLNVPISADEPPPIPNEALLNHFERHDLRYAIANMGGRDVVSSRLNGAKLIPGKWTQAVRTCKEVQYLLRNHRGLSEDVPPISPHVKRSLQIKLGKVKARKQTESIDENKYVENLLEEIEVMMGDVNDDDDDVDTPIEKLRFTRGHRWAHSSARNPRGHWSQDVIIQELYQYLSYVKEEKGRPSVWMPRPSELSTERRDDLKQAMVRFGGSARICELAELVPYRDWRYFESNLEMFVELLKYLVKYHNGSEKVFPKLADIQGHDSERLYDLIMEYGGRKIIATKLDMEFQAQTKLERFKGISFGPFSVDFAVRLMHFIRNDMMEKDPPLERPYIQMPTRLYLLQKGEKRLAMEVEQYGGHESIARRLHLAFDRDEARRDASKG